MTTAQQTDPEVAAYARQVREALADVPPARVEELLEDLEEHLVEVASETPGPLTDRLGPAAEYAAELRRAAGLPEGPAPETAVLDGWRWDLQRYRARWVDHPAVVQAREFLPELRPAWWVVRGWAAVAAVGVVFLGAGVSLLPTLGVGVLGWLITGAAVVLSVRQGLRDRVAARPLSHRAAAVNLVLAVCTLIALVGLVSRSAEAAYPEPASFDSGPTTLVHEDGTPITNIVPYGSDGEPLTGVLLYDQDGRPIEDLSTHDDQGQEIAPLEEVAPQPGNAFPQQQGVVVYDEYGNRSVEPVLPPGVVGP